MNKVKKTVGMDKKAVDKKVTDALKALETELAPAKLPRPIRQDLDSSIARLRTAVGKI
jgi:hypothetical protein